MVTKDESGHLFGGIRLLRIPHNYRPSLWHAINSIRYGTGLKYHALYAARVLTFAYYDNILSSSMLCVAAHLDVPLHAVIPSKTNPISKTYTRFLFSSILSERTLFGLPQETIQIK